MMRIPEMENERDNRVVLNAEDVTMYPNSVFGGIP